VLIQGLTMSLPLLKLSLQQAIISKEIMSFLVVVSNPFQRRYKGLRVHITSSRVELKQTNI